MAEAQKTARELVIDMVSSSLAKLKLDVNFSVDYPQEAVHGDYATNVALVASKLLKRSAPELAYEIMSNFDIERDVFEQVEVSSAGFINFFLKKDYVLNQLPLIAKAGYGQSSVGQKRKVNVEFISANPTGPLHLGHARGAFYGDALSSILKLAGYDVTREYYINDARESNQIRELGRTVLGAGTSYAGAYLDLKIKEFEEKGFSFMGLNEAEVGRLVAQAIQDDNQKFIRDTLNIKFNKWFSEESLYQDGLTDSVFQALQKQGLVYQKDGALWVKSTEFGDVRDRVLVRSQEKGGAATYYYTDIPYYLNKVERGFELLIYILGADHHDDAYFLRILPKVFGREVPIEVILTQMVTFKKENLAVRLSKRKGEVINLEWLLEQVGLDAARFFYLLKSPNTHMEFDVDLAKTKNLQNPVFYIQYSHARLVSILRKAKATHFGPDFKNPELLSREEELALVKTLMRFPELIVDISFNRQVHQLPHYLQSLAVQLNSFYEKVRVIDEKNPELTNARLGLIQASKNVVGKALELLGMSAPLKM